MYLERGETPPSPEEDVIIEAGYRFDPENLPKPRELDDHSEAEEANTETEDNSQPTEVPLAP